VVMVTILWNANQVLQMQDSNEKASPREVIHGRHMKICKSHILVYLNVYLNCLFGAQDIMV
jgi:hypothetical protein